MDLKSTDQYEVDYRRETLDTFIKNRRKKIFKLIGVLIVLAIIGSIAWKFASIDSGAKKALREAKDVRIGISMLAVEKYGKNESVFDATSTTGLTEGSEEKILAASNANGHLSVLAWDEASNAPTAFIYEKDQYIVHYDAESDDQTWRVFYTYQVLGY